MVNLSKKLYISIFSVLLLLVVMGTATYAWFELNTNAWFDDMELKVNSGEGIKISVDGVNFSYNLTKADIKKAVVAKSKGYTISPDGNYYNQGGQKISSSNYDADFARIELSAVTSIDGKNFTTREGKLKTYSDLDFVGLDIYFASDNPESSSPINVNFSIQRIVLENGTVIPKSEVVTDESKGIIGFPSGLTGNFVTYNKETGLADTYYKYQPLSNQSETIQNFKSYASDAIRFSVTTSENPNITKIYEPNEGNGSYATDLSDIYYSGAIGAKYDKSKNAAHTYFNTLRGINPEDEVYVNYEDLPFTYKSFDTLDASKVLTLNSENNYGQNGDCKASINIWLEGMDADCFDAIYEQIVQLKFSFTSFVSPNEPLDVTFKTINPVTGFTEKEVTRAYYPELPITTYEIAKDVYSTVPKKFVGWALETNPNQLYDLTVQRTKAITLISVWE